ncbi:MAG: DUF3243 family protein [Thermaerobacter sp.]|nr:DUF3243 family protein [Thermaerobacter sp.]
MANQGNGVPRSFQDLKARAAAKIQRGDQDVHNDIIEMGDAMLQAGVEPQTHQDHVAKSVWQSSQPHEKRMLADLVARMAKAEADTTNAADPDALG